MPHVLIRILWSSCLLVFLCMWYTQNFHLPLCEIKCLFNLSIWCRVKCLNQKPFYVCLSFSFFCNYSVRNSNINLNILHHGLLLVWASLKVCDSGFCRVTRGNFQFMPIPDLDFSSIKQLQDHLTSMTDRSMIISRFVVLPKLSKHRENSRLVLYLIAL